MNLDKTNEKKITHKDEQFANQHTDDAPTKESYIMEYWNICPTND